jgi:hypothetical protein
MKYLNICYVLYHSSNLALTTENVPFLIQ